MLRRLVCGLLVCGLAACSSTRIEREAASTRQGRVYLIRGFLTPFSLGVDKLARDLRAYGLEATAHSHLQAGEIAREIEAVKSRRADNEPLVLIGYSTGADTACSVARRLQRSGIAIDLLIAIDAMPTSSKKVPPNVRHCVNYQQAMVAGVPLLSGRRATAEAPNATSMENIDVRNKGFYEGILHHFNMDEQPLLTADVRTRILAICAPRKPPSKARSGPRG